jgi:hypothetical protein
MRVMRLSFAMSLSLLVLAVAASAQQPSSIAIHGHVVADNTGTPSPGATVTLTVSDAFISIRRKRVVTTTDEHGAFAFSEVQPGDYSLYVEGPNFLAESVWDVTSGKEITVRLRREGVIRGRVTDADGEAVRKVVVEVMRKSYQYGEVGLFAVSMGFAYTDNDGTYRVGGIPPGRYYVRASQAEYDTVLYPNAAGLDGARVIDIAPGVEKSGTDFALNRGQRFTLEGRLVDAGTQGPAQATFLRVYSADLITGTFADGDIHGGDFRVRGLRPGRYFLNFSWVGPTNNVTRSVVFPFDMGTADQSGVVLHAIRTTVAGRLKALGGELPYSLSVYLEPAAAISAHIPGGGAGADVEPDGTFEMKGVTPGEYHLRVHSAEAPNFVTADRVVVVDGNAPIIGVGVELDFAVGAVKGRAVDGGRMPIPRTFVVLQSTDPGKLLDQRYQFVHPTGPDGEFAITGVAPGEYLLFVCGNPDAIGDPDLFVLAKQKARIVTVKSGSTLSQNAIKLPIP